MPEKVRFSLIIVSYNNTKLLRECVRSIFDQSFSSYEIIIVDNASDDECVKYLHSLENCKIVFNENNFGFAKANNIGYGNSVGEWIILLNNDTVLPKNFLSKINEIITSNKKTDILGPLVLSEDGFPQPTFNFLNIYSEFIIVLPKIRKFHRELSFGANSAKKQKVLKKFEYKYNFVTWHEVNAISGVCMIINRNVIENIGLFDENYFMYIEDIDFCFRAKKEGYNIFFSPDIFLTHFIKPIDQKKHLKNDLYDRNLLYFIKKSYSFTTFLTANVIIKLKKLVKTLSFLISKD